MIRPDIATFNECVAAAKAARQHRADARRIRGRSAVHGRTLGECELAARRAERLVRIAADWAIREVEHFGARLGAGGSGSRTESG